MNVLWIKDGKKGHEKQVKVLLDEISKSIDIKIFEENYLIDSFARFIEIFDHATNYFMGGLRSHDLTILKYKKHNIDIVIGAGSNTYTRMLLIKKALKKDYSKNVNAISVLVPSFFQSEFDIICAPKHDSYKLSQKSNVIFFEGSIAEVSDQIPADNIGFMGIGGKNKHFIFNHKKLLQQIEYILSIYSNLQWSIFPSRRTPKEMIKELHALKSQYSNLKLCTNNIDETIKNATIKIVTQDSVNMVFECLSTKGQTYLFNMKYFKKNKIVNLMNGLLENQQVGYIEYSKMADGLNKIKMVNSNKHYEIFAEVEKVAYELIKKISK